MEENLTNKKAIIAGASRGIGRALALKLAGEGADVHLIARSRQQLAELTDRINEAGHKATYYTGDLTQKKDVTRIIEKIGVPVDILVNNAGTGIFKPVEEFTEEDWDTVMSVNVKATFLTSQAIIPIMKEQKDGIILTIASDSSKFTFPEGSLYCASKFAQEGFTNAMRKELRKFGIRVKTIYPGFTDTPFHDHLRSKAEREGFMKPEDVASAAVHLLKAPGNVTYDELMMHPSWQEY